MLNHTFKVQWEERGNSSSNPSRKATTIQATSAMEAKEKVKSRIMTNVEVINMTAFKIN